MIVQNLHTHTVYCDGKNTAEEMLLSALNKGMTSIGFSGHAFAPHDTSYCMSLENTQIYAKEVLALRERYKGKIDVYLGLEQDYFSVPPTIECDYIIGSVHYVFKDGEYIPVDETKEITVSAINRLYGGDVYSYLEDYFNLIGGLGEKTNCDIVGHIDLPEKFNADGNLFDRKHPRYISAYTNAVSRLVSLGKIFEINTGAMSRGYTAQPYPHEDILREIIRLGGRVTVSSDCHSVDTVDYMLEQAAQIAFECGADKIEELNLLKQRRK